MKILYGVAGEGFGHSSRAKEIITHLIKKHHEVKIITYGQAYPVLKYLNPIKIHGIKLHFTKHGLHLAKTIQNNIPKLLKNLENRERINEQVNKFNPDICITDFEPTVPIISFWKNLPLISIDNQHRLTHLPLKVPKEYQKDYLLAKIATENCVRSAHAFIILSFTKGKPKAKNDFIVSPILRESVIKLNPKKANQVLVYLTKPNSKILSILKSIKENFIVYGYNKEKRQSNLHFKKSGQHFIADLAICKAVIASSGFSLMSEALYLKKPYFAIPLKGQFEQTLNALFLKDAKYGDFSETPTKKQLQEFLSSLPKYEKALKSYKMNPKEAAQTLDKILKKIKR